jgi:hypothetical protein
MIHHIIPKHEWKKRFGNIKGVNSIDNLIELTVQQHAQVHALLYEINGEEYDRIASITLSGLIGQEEAMKLTSSCTMMGNKHCLGKKNSLGYRHTEEFKRKQRKESLEMYNTNNRLDLAEEISNILKDQTNINFGQAMKLVMSKVKGDNKIIADIIKSLI